jgi:ATP-binding cassette, subfamily F, member 3
VLLSVTRVQKGFGTDVVLSEVSFMLDRREKVALVGRNGTGKTTLLRIITGQMEPDGGNVALARDAKVGYLRQEARLQPGRTVLEEAQEAVRHALELRGRLDELEKKLEGEHSPEDLEEYTLLHERFVEAEGYLAENSLKAVLSRMGFTEEEFDKPVDKLSGGEKTRLMIAKLLLEEPDLLILDEPTNHLDLQATEWLEGWLRDYHGTALVVSHDRTFLENVAQRVLEMRNGSVKSYPGPFNKFLQLRAEEDARLAEVAKRQEQEIAKLDEYVRRFMGSERTAQARGRLKMMNRLIESKVDAPSADKTMKGGFGKVARAGDTVMECKRLGMRFGEERLFKDLDWTVRWGERWGLIGENGAGKSTLVKIALGLIEPTEGIARLGSNVAAGYFSQENEDLDQDMSPLDFMVWECDMLPADARNLLGRFLFSGDDVYRPIRTLSGGEKNKLSLARLVNLNPNLLVLDEPTNHLDMDSREALAGVLREYKGTLVLVSHDRWLLELVTNQTLDLRRQGPIFYPGSYGEYRYRQAQGAKPPTSARTAPSKPAENAQPEMTPRELSKELARVTKLVEELEAAVTAREQELRALEETLASLPAHADVMALTLQHSQLQSELEGTLAAWEEQSSYLEQLHARRG